MTLVNITNYGDHLGFKNIHSEYVVQYVEEDDNEVDFLIVVWIIKHNVTINLVPIDVDRIVQLYLSCRVC